MDYVAQLRCDVEAFEAAARRATQQEDNGSLCLVPSCPGWSMADLVFHLGSVHRHVIQVVSSGRRGWPQRADRSWLRLPTGRASWPDPQRAPNHGPLPPSLLDWFREGASRLAELLAGRDPAERVWTWGREQSVGFWQRMQAIEAAVHRWDAENAVGSAGPLERLLAMDAVTHTFEVMAPARRRWSPAPPGQGERMRFRQSDGFGIWVVQLDTEGALLNHGTGCCHAELTATASDLALFLWHRIPKDGLEVRGDASLLDLYFKVVPPQ
ncbi:maleylpyruvate isomerase family mycothiol-dependent enzyme [Streptomyces sp. NPDC050400]|uniref:maleylpyruvate isomerase family mycothiol-dependent enzyme n=1 Tax=Streptomyces sp. NPDC050400 TaxID=3365610 RepID=UPI0037AA1276